MPDQGFTGAVDGLPAASGGVPPGAPEPGAMGEGAGASGLAAGGVLGGGVLGGGVPAGAVLAGGVLAGRGLGSNFLCFLGASGSTSGPFWPHPTSKPARQRATHTCTNFMG
jgi:hypothetical protein